MKYLLDTDIASYYLRGKFDLVLIFERKGYPQIRLSRITIAQLEVLAYKNPKSSVNDSAIQKLSQKLGVLDPDINTWRIFSMIKAENEKKGQPRGDLDVLQAAIAKQNNLVVVTNNVRHFEGLIEIENWTEE